MLKKAFTIHLHLLSCYLLIGCAILNIHQTFTIIHQTFTKHSPSFTKHSPSFTVIQQTFTNVHQHSPQKKSQTRREEISNKQFSVSKSG